MLTKIISHQKGLIKPLSWSREYVWLRTPTPVNPLTTWQIRTADGIPNVIGGTYPRVSGCCRDDTLVDEVLSRVNKISQLRTRAVLIVVLNGLLCGVQLGEQASSLRAVQLRIRRNACPQVVKRLQHALHGNCEAA